MLRRLLSDPSEYPAELRTWIYEYLGVNPPQFIPSQVAGLIQIQFSPVASVTASQTTASTAYGDLATTGPGLSSMRKGRYFLVYGFFGVSSNSANAAMMAPSANGATPSDREAAQTRNTLPHTVMRATIVSLELPSNQVQMKYRASAGSTSTFNDRFLIAARIGEA